MKTFAIFVAAELALAAGTVVWPGPGRTDAGPRVA
jgi:hypothetical protein